MDLTRVLALYDAEVRATPSGPGVSASTVGGVVRLTGDFNFVSAWDLTEDTAAAVVAEQAAHFRARGESLIWRVYGHDRPESLPRLLADNGFKPEPPGTLMFFDLTRELSAAGGDIEVRRVDGLRALDDFVEASDAAFGDDEASRRRGGYARRLDDPNLAMFVAYLAGAPVASARLQMADGQPFGLMFGGGVKPEHRGLGIYRALVAARAELARSRALAFLSTEARDTSRPILQRLGFIPAGRETTWILPPASDG